MAAGTVALALADPARAQIAKPRTFVQGLTGLVTSIVGVPGPRHRVFFTTQQGLVRCVEDGLLVSDPVLDLRPNTYSTSEAGLLGLALHPDFETNGRLYVYQTVADPRRNMVVEFTVMGDPRTSNVVDPQSRREVIPLLGSSLHNGGWIGFGPDRLLYVAVGDGFSSSRAQDLTSLGGKLLRIDVDSTQPGLAYGIPPTNPLAAPVSVDPPRPIRPEIWALGLRNPWRCSFDRATGDLWIGDVGKVIAEEINAQAAVSLGGENYGWDCWEGTHATGLPGCGATPAPGVPPALEVRRAQNPDFDVVIGGYVYRGSLIPRLWGHYVFGSELAVYSFEAASPPAPGTPVENLRLWPDLLSQVTFGEDVDGELYGGSYGRIYRLVAVACGRADLTATSNPTERGYGEPNGVLDEQDFFYYFQQFAAGNVAVADLTASAVAGSPGYGVPNGVLNSEDFFYYLTLYSQGC